MAADLPSEPFNREEQYLADIAGQNVEVPPCPWNRKEAYLAEIGGRLDDMDDRISALATDLSFKGSVATENDLPTGAAVGDTYITEDTGIIYVWVGEEWVAINDTGGSGITVLTSADVTTYPGPAGTGSNSIGLWRLPSGMYQLDGVTGYARNNNTTDYVAGLYAKSGAIIIVSQSPGSIGSIYEMQCIMGNNVSSGWTYTSIAGRFVRNYLSQTTGQDINIGMTQKAITDALDKKSPMTILYVSGQDFAVNKSGSQLYVYKESSLTNKYSGSELYTLAAAHTDFVIHAINTDGTADIYRAFYVGLPSANTDEAFDEDGNFYIVSRYTYGGRDIGLSIMSVDTEYISVYVS